MKLTWVALCGFALGAVSGAASAAEGEVRNWSAGAGLTLGPVFDGALIGGVAIGGLGSLSPSVTLERRLGDSWWLEIEGHGGLSIVDGTNVSLHSRQLGAALGPRLILSSGLPVEISSFLLLGLSASVTDQGIPNGGQAQSTSLSSAVGLALSRELVSDLWLRVSTPVLVGSWAKSRSAPPGGVVSETQALSLAVSLAPTLTLNLAF